MKYVRLALALAGCLCVSNFTARAQFASAVVSYNPGSGFAAGFTNAGAALGAPASGAAVTPFSPAFSKSQLVSIGAGGEIDLQLATPIVNTTADPYNVNFMLFANEFFVSSGGKAGGLFDHSASIEVQVSQDDSTWYTLDPSLAPQAGSLFPTDGSGNPLLPVNPSLTLSDFNGQTLAGVESLYDGSAGGTGYDLSWAQDSGGNFVDISSADYVRIEVQSGVLDLDALAVTQAAPDSTTTFWLLGAAAAGLAIWKRFSARPAFVLTTLAALAFVSGSRAATLTENFATNPLRDGWHVFGDASLFQWDSTNQNLDVTWDSTQPNSYFYHPLGTILTSNDDFTLAFDLQINSAAAYNYGFELTIGLLNLDEATSTNFSRGTGDNSPDLVEFDYFPDVGYGPTIWPLFVDSESIFYFPGDSVYAIYAPNLGDWYHVVMSYTASNITMVTTMTNYEGTSGILVSEALTNFAGDFYVNTLSVNSYQDDGVGDSIYATGVVDNFSVTLPPPAIQNQTELLTNGVWQARFLSQSNWLYELERSANLQCWTPASATVAGSGTNLVLCDTNAPAQKAFYRINAFRP